MWATGCSIACGINTNNYIFLVTKKLASYILIINLFFAYYSKKKFTAVSDKKFKKIMFLLLGNFNLQVNEDCIAP